MEMTVYVYPLQKYSPGEVDALEYCKRFGEHMLAVKVQQFRQGKIQLNDFLPDLMQVCEANGHNCINSPDLQKIR